MTARSLAGDKRGVTTVFFAASAVAMMAVMGLVVDVGDLVTAKRRLQGTTDLAAIAGATDLAHAVRLGERTGPGQTDAPVQFLAGGTTLYDLMKLDIERPAHLIDVTAIGGLDMIQTGGDRLRFGALAPMSAVMSNTVVLHDYPVLAQSLALAASQQLRNMATVGGNLLQRTRCLYFRNGAGGTSAGNVYPCNKREPGSGCAAIEGSDRGQAVLGQSGHCTAVSPGDWPVALVALDAHAVLLGPSGERRSRLTSSTGCRVRPRIWHSRSS